MREANLPMIDHWRRFRRLIAFMVAIAVLAVAIALWVLHSEGVILHLQFMIAMGLGISLSLLLAGVLMGLAFVSASSGHDDAVESWSDDHQPKKPRLWNEPRP